MNVSAENAMFGDMIHLIRGDMTECGKPLGTVRPIKKDDFRCLKCRAIMLGVEVMANEGGQIRMYGPSSWRVTIRDNAGNRTRDEMIGVIGELVRKCKWHEEAEWHEVKVQSASKNEDNVWTFGITQEYLD